MEVIAAVSAANSAYATIKKALANGSEISSVLPHIGNVLTAEEKLKKATNKKSPLQSLLGKKFNDFDAFAEQEKLRARRMELEQWMKLMAPMGTWDRWVKFQAEARKKAREEEKEREHLKQKRTEIMMISLLFLGGLSLTFFFTYVALKTKGFI